MPGSSHTRNPMISAFDLFKIGIGPSSSHTVGPMVAARRFRARTLRLPGLARIQAEIFGSLAWTGRGHGTDAAIFLGLLGHEPQSVDPDAVAGYVADLGTGKRLAPGGPAFDPGADLAFNFTDVLPLHTNALRFRALDAAGAILDTETYYSVGGGFVVTEAEAAPGAEAACPRPYASAAGLLALCAQDGLTIAQV